jgi:hypothetical protein
MSEKFLTVGSNGEYPEVLAFGASDFIDTSVGPGSAGLPIVLDSNGLIDSSFINFGTIDHGGLNGLGDDDHTQYTLADGTRPFGGVVAYTMQPTFNDDLQLVSKKYVDDVAESLEWQESVLSAGVLNPTSLTPSVGDRYLINGVGAGTWTGQDNKIATWNGSGWEYYTPTTGARVGADDEPNVAFYLFGGVSWEAKLVESTTASTGLVKVGQDIQLDPASAGNGLGFNAGVYNVNVDDSSIEIDSDTLRVKALGITNAMLAGGITDAKLDSDYIQTSEVDDATIEFSGGTLNIKSDGVGSNEINYGTGAGQVNSSQLPIIDAGGFTSESFVEGALQELYGLVKESGNTYTANGSITKGDLVYVSGADQVSTYSTITTFQLVVGVALESVANGQPVKVLANDVIIESVLAGATPGTRYFWNGTGYQTSIPSTPLAYIYAGGVARNTTDVHTEVVLIKRNSAS